MRQITRGWFLRLASSTAVVFAFVFGLDRPLYAQATLIVSYYGANPDPTKPQPGINFSATNAPYTTGIQVGPTVKTGTGEGETCIAGAAPKLFVADRLNGGTDINYYQLNSAMTGVTAGPFLFAKTVGETASLSLNRNGLLYAAAEAPGGGIYAFYTTAGTNFGKLAAFTKLPGAHDVVYDPIARSGLGIVYATSDSGTVVNAYDPNTLTPLTSYDITLPPLPSGTFAQKGLAVDPTGNLFVSNFGTNLANNTTQPGVYEYPNATSTPNPIVFFSTLFDHPLGLAIGPGDGKIYVANFGDMTGTTNTGGVLQIDPVGSYPGYVVQVSLTQTPPPETNPKYLQFIENCTPATSDGYIEVCKLSSTTNPVPANGIYNFTVTGSAFSSSPLMVPVGECSGPIPVTPPATMIVEGQMPGVAISSITAVGYSPPPFSAFEPDLLESSEKQMGTAMVIVQAPATPGDTSTETLVTFTNYEAPPAQLKICKIAGSTNVTGTFTFVTSSTATPPSFPPITDMVEAGPLTEGGYCTVVSGTFQVGVPVSVTEMVPGGYTSPTITVNGVSTQPTAGCAPPVMFPFNAFSCSVIAAIGAGINEVSFTNIPIIGPGDRGSAISNVDIVNYSLVRQVAATGTQSYMTYRADLLNTGTTIRSPLIARLTSLDPSSVQVVGQGTLNFASAPANSQVPSSNTFTILTDPAVPLDFSKLSWTYQSRRSVSPRR